MRQILKIFHKPTNVIAVDRAVPIGWFAMATGSSSFERFGPASPQTPVVVSVPHAGREYPMALRAALRVPLAALVALEDRHLDAVALAAHAGADETMFVQRLPRAWIDLNRAEHERDPRIDEGVSARTMGQTSAKLRAGLGLVPRRTPAAGDIWRGRLSGDEVKARITGAHRPYHCAVADALSAARARFGVAILFDLHSMPPLASGAQLVLGDRFGRSAGARFVGRLETLCEATGVRHALNTPYAGGHVLERHGVPAAGIHAIQLEIDRALYLDARLDQPGPGVAQTARMVRAMIDALTDEALDVGLPLAAE